jgi:glycosyltransferase involved in cell wall biosynthesis
MPSSDLRPATLSLVIPMYNEEENIAVLTERLNTLIGRLNLPTQVIFVDDHSNDATPTMLAELCAQYAHYEYVRLAANSGSHIAIIAGMAHATGDAVVFLAADLQDPPELIPQMLEKWRDGAHIVWAVRAKREGISRADKATASLTYRIINLFGKVKLPPEGSDFALVDAQVVRALLRSVRANPSLGLEIARLGFEQVTIPYTKEARYAGVTKWNLSKKITAFIDAIVTTSYVPLRLMSYVGLTASILGFLYALLIIVLRFINPVPIEGWSALMVVVLVFGGVQMMMLGILGEYLWRTLETARQRPLYIVERTSLADESAQTHPQTPQNPL